jgi:hypothetical protein
LAPVFSRLAGRLVTGPLAFLVAGLIDVVIYWTEWLINLARGRRRPSTMPRP